MVNPHVTGRLMYQEFSDLVAQVSTVRHVSVQLGTFPTNMFLQQKASFAVNGPTPAREAMKSLLLQAGLRMQGDSPRFAWSLTFDPSTNGYFLNIVEVMPRAPRKWIVVPQPPPPAVQPSAPSNSKAGHQQQ